jgi:hypothetical protein
MLLGWSPASSLFVDEDASARQSASAVQTACLGRGSRNALYDPLWSLVRERLIPHREGPKSAAGGQQSHVSGSDHPSVAMYSSEL